MSEVISKKRIKSSEQTRITLKKIKGDHFELKTKIIDITENIEKISKQLSQVVEYLQVSDMRFKILEASIESHDDDLIKLKTYTPPLMENCQSPEITHLPVPVKWSPAFDLAFAGNEDAISMSPLDLKELEHELYCNEVMD